MAVEKFIFSLIGILIFLCIFLLSYYYFYTKTEKKYDKILIGAVITYLPALACGLVILSWSELPLSIEFPRSTATRLAMNTDVFSTTSFVLCRYKFEDTLSLIFGFKKQSEFLYLRLIIVLGIAALSLNISEWLFNGNHLQALALTHATIRIVLTIFCLFRLCQLFERFKNLKITRKRRRKVLLLLVCSTGIGTSPFMIYRVYCLAQKDHRLTVTIMWCEIIEGALDIAFLCFSYTFTAVLSLFCWLKGRPREPYDGASERSHDEFSTANASRPSQESRYAYQSTENILLAEQGRLNKMLASS